MNAVALAEAFGVEVGELRDHPGGFEAEAFTDGHWFVKRWPGEPDSERSLALTAELAAHGLPVPGARRALDGGHTALVEGRRCALFPFWPGRPGGWEDAEAIAGAMRSVHAVVGPDLPTDTMDEDCIAALREHRDHPWLAGRGDEVLAGVDRLEAVIARARTIEVPHVVCHRDLFPHNVLVDDDGRIAALLDWGQTRWAPREHDLFVALCGPEPVRFLQAYGADDLDPTHLEYARLARSLRDLTARVVAEVDRDGVETWGFDGLRRVDADLELARPFCRRGRAGTVDAAGRQDPPLS